VAGWAGAGIHGRRRGIQCSTVVAVDYAGLAQDLRLCEVERHFAARRGPQTWQPLGQLISS